MAERVDVDAVLKKYQHRAAFGPYPHEADELAEVRAAVAELIEADREFNRVLDMGILANPAKFLAANERRRSALARVGGGS